MSFLKDVEEIMYRDIAADENIPRKVKEALLDAISDEYDRREKVILERRKKVRQQQEALFNEIYDILNAHPGIGFTATDIQFRIPDFVRRDITNQKVLGIIQAITRNPIPEKRIAIYRTSNKTFFTTDKGELSRPLRDKYIGKEFRRVDQLYC